MTTQIVQQATTGFFGSLINAGVQLINAHLTRKSQIESEEKRQVTQLKLAHIQMQNQAQLYANQQQFQVGLSALNHERQAQLQVHQQQFQGKLQADQQKFQERMAILGFSQNVSLEKMRQEFQERLSALSHERQMEITQFSKQVDLAISQQNLDFQKWRFEQEKQLQLDLADYNRQTQFALAAYQRETTLKLPEIHKLFENWPLRMIPSHILSSESSKLAITPLRVIIAPPAVDFDRFQNLQASKNSFPNIEKRVASSLHQLQEQFYPLNSQKRAIEILDGAWDSARYYGGASIRVLFEMLKSEPCLILQSEVDGDDLSFRIAYWGFGQSNYGHQTLIRRFSYRQMLYESAKARALKWKTNVKDKLLAHGKSLEEINKRFGPTEAFNLAILEEEQLMKELGIEYEAHYKLSQQDFEELFLFLESYHCIVTAVFADAYHLIYYNTPPLLAEWLPKYLNVDSALQRQTLFNWIFSTYQELFQALEVERSQLISEISLRLTSELANLEDRSFSKQLLAHSLNWWRELPASPSLEVHGIMESLINPFSQAISDYNLPDNSTTLRQRLHRARAELFEQLQHYDYAIVDYNELLRLQPKSVYFLVRRGLIYQKQGNYQQALDDYDTALRLNPNHILALQARASMTERLIEDAANFKKLSLQQQEQLINELLLRGQAHEKQGNYQQALDDYDTALRLNPNHKELQKRRQQAYEAKHPPLGIGSEYISPKDGMVMVYVPRGKFPMGSRNDDPDASSDEKPQHEVYLDGYWIDKTLVTNAMFAKFVQETGYQTEAEKAKDSNTWRSKAASGRENHPVVYVSWDDAVAYAKWAGRRLPTEAEWEKAAGGTDGRKYPWGNNPPTDKLCNFGMNIKDTTPVGKYPAGASPYGALDMAGNVWEWCSDTFDSSYYASSPKANPHNESPNGTKVLCGGSWFDSARDSRVRFRDRYVADNRVELGGFRCAC